jgi:transglutaminase-like putative cysteine protease
VPAGISAALDAWGNTVHRAWFAGLTDTLRIVSEGEGYALRSNPFDYLIETPEQLLPPQYSPEERAALWAYLQAEESPTVAEFADSVLRSMGSNEPSADEFLIALTEALSDRFTSVVRPEGAPYEPERTLATREVSCRDLAVLYIAVCRKSGIAARFVSGYQAGDPDQKERDLHAWVEAYLPRAGWRAFDPTLGLAVTDGHLAVAAAAKWPDAAPLTGSWRGTGVRSELRSIIELSTETVV